MDEKQSRILELLERYERGALSQEELQELEQWYQSFENDPKFSTGLTEEAKTAARENLLKRIDWQLDRELEEKLRVGKEKPFWRIWPRIMIAASILVFISIGLYFTLFNNQQTEATAENFQQFTPGSSKAVLTLNSGQKIVLNDARNGQLAMQGQAIVNKTADGEISYTERTKRTSEGKVLTNTMSTPRGGQYHLTLADGTGVWLNAESSITFPVAFAGGSREVEIRGEVYFEVAHDQEHPFRVKSEGQTVEVLGTHFNINSYTDENAIRTTLLEGSVRVLAGNSSKVIAPGQQAIVNGLAIRTKSIDTDEEVSWKSGYFDFNDTDIQTVMRQLARWYDVEISFEGNITKDKFTGRIPRKWNLGQIMKVVNSSRSVHLKLEGRRIMVTD